MNTKYWVVLSRTYVWLVYYIQDPRTLNYQYGFCTAGYGVKSLRPSDAYVCQKTMSSLIEVHVMVCRPLNEIIYHICKYTNFILKMNLKNSPATIRPFGVPLY